MPLSLLNDRYKEGSGLGKGGGGIKEPLAITTKQDKTGVGLVEHVKEQQDKLKVLAQMRAEEEEKLRGHFKVSLLGFGH